MKNIMQKFLNKETISYLIFGVLTTIVNIVVFDLCEMAMDYKAANIIAWVIAVAFAYITNKLFVFSSKSFAPEVLIKEITSFVFARVVSLGVDMGFMIVAIEYLGMAKLLAKIISNVFVVIINYVFSKLVIFRKKQ